MKALIVDDEKHVREAIRLLVDWKSYGIEDLLEAEDGQSAIRLIAGVQPELVFTDMMMPGMGGAALLEWIKAHAPRTRTIVISGHDDFELVRAAVKCGGLDYILKPIDPAELQEAVSKAVQSRLQEEESLLVQQQRNIEVNTIKPVYWERMLSTMLEDPSCFDMIQDSMARELNAPSPCLECRVAVLSLSAVPPDLRRKFGSGLDLLSFSLTNICNEYMTKRRSGYAFRYGGGTGGHIVLLFWRNLAAAEDEVRQIHEGIARALKGRLDFGLSQAAAFPRAAGAAFREAVHALRSRNLLQRTGWLHLPVPASESRKPLPFREYEEELRLALKSGSSEQIGAVAGDWSAAVSQWKIIAPEQVELWQQEFNMFQSRWLKEALGSGSGEGEEEGISGLSQADLTVPLEDNGGLSLPRWSGILLARLLELAELYKRRLHEDKHVIYEIAKYIQAHYQEDLTLQDIADRFFLSREYISRKFKQEFKENLSDYLGRIRIEKARLLLLNPNCKISQIAEQVGYQDEKYFSKVFKKWTGQTPGDYRKNPTVTDSKRG